MAFKHVKINELEEAEECVMFKSYPRCSSYAAATQLDAAEEALIREGALCSGYKIQP